MNFSDESSLKVVLDHPEIGDLGEAQLRFGGEAGIIAAWSPSAIRDLPTANLDFVKATAEDGREFTLCDCRVHGWSLVADFLVLGHISKNTFVQIHIRFSDVSEWFLRWERVEGTVGDTLTWSQRSTPLSVEITEGDKRFTLKSAYVGERERIGEDLILHEYILFSFHSVNAAFTLDQARDKAAALAALFSLLLAYPISIVSVHLTTADDRSHSIYFSHFKPLQRNKTRDFAMQCFLQKRSIDDRWPSLFTAYFSDANRRDLWLRLAGMQRYEGFWDFELIGYVGLLDRYVARGTQEADIPAPPGQQKVKSLMKALCKTRPAFSRPQIAAIVQTVKRIFSTYEPSFAQRFRDAMERTDSDIRAVIDLSESDFELLKNIRDRIAHGQAPMVPAFSFGRINTTIRKIELLLTYWTMFDLGIPKKLFLQAMNATHNRMYLKASVNRRSLARATDTASFFNISAEQFEQWKLRNDLRFHACLIKGPNGELEVSSDFAEKWRRWQQTSSGGISKWEDIFGVANEAVKYQHTVYIECGDQSLELTSTCIFEKARLNHPG